MTETNFANAGFGAQAYQSSTLPIQRVTLVVIGEWAKACMDKPIHDSFVQVLFV